MSNLSDNRKRVQRNLRIQADGYDAMADNAKKAGYGHAVESYYRDVARRKREEADKIAD